MQKIIYSFLLLQLLSSFSSLNGMTPQQTAQKMKPEEKQPEDAQKLISELESQRAHLIDKLNIKSLEEFDNFEDFLQNVKETTEQLKAVLPPRPSTPNK